MEVCLIRHTSPAVEQGVCYGQSDISLADTAEAEWSAIRESLPHNIAAIYTSPLKRCLELSARLEAHYGLEATTDNRLMEMNFGDWEMKRWDDVDQQDLNIWMNDFLHQRCPGGESYQDVKNRLCDFISDNLISDDQNYLIVTHGGVIKCFHGLANGGDGMNFTIPYGGLYCYDGTLNKLLAR